MKAGRFGIPIAVLLAVAVGAVVFFVFSSGEEGPITGLQSTYDFTSETPWWMVELWINDQPALVLEGRAAGEWPIVPFVIDGENRVFIDAARNPKLVFGPEGRSPCSLKVTEEKIQGQDIYRNLLHHAEVPAGAVDTMLEEGFAFTATVPMRWRWQDADEIRALSAEDREAIFDLWHRLVAASEKHDADAVMALFAHWYAGARPTLAGQALLPDIDAYSEQLTESLFFKPMVVAPDEEIELVEGTRLVLMHCRGTVEDRYGPIKRSLLSRKAAVPVSGQPPEDDPNSSFTVPLLNAIYFVRVDGQWQMMLPDWRW